MNQTPGSHKLGQALCAEPRPGRRKKKQKLKTQTRRTGGTLLHEREKAHSTPKHLARVHPPTAPCEIGHGLRSSQSGGCIVRRQVQRKHTSQGDLLKPRSGQQYSPRPDSHRSSDRTNSGGREDESPATREEGISYK